MRIKDIKNKTPRTINNKRADYLSIGEFVAIAKKNAKTRDPHIHFAKKKYHTDSYPKNGIFVRRNAKKISLLIRNYNNNKQKCKCHICKKEAHYVTLERDSGNRKNPRLYYINIYTVDSITNQEIFFNIDHIKPKSKGGTDALENLSLTCESCNTEKADTYREKFNIFNILKSIFTLKWKKT
jgi:hypothetical protein